VPCQYCKTDVYLPDDLWRRLHPVKTMAPWFVRFEGRSRAELARAAEAKLSEQRRAEEVKQRELGRLAEAEHLDAELADQAARARKLMRGIVAFCSLAAAAIASFLIWDARHPKLAPTSAADRPDFLPGMTAIAQANLLQSPQGLARELTGKLSNGDPPHFFRPSEGGRKIEMFLTFDKGGYHRLDVRWAIDHDDHPNEIWLDAQPRQAFSPELPGGLNQQGIWQGSRARLQVEPGNGHFEKGSMSFRVDADDASNPSWRLQADAAWKLIFSAAFGLKLQPTAAEMRALAGP
jgi:hypothetical protein